MNYVLTHHDIKGYINETIEYIKRILNFIKTKKKVDEIIRSMNAEDKRKLGMNEHNVRKSKYLDMGYSILLVKRFIKEVNGLPVAFLDVIQNEDSIIFAAGTRGEFQGKGYGTEIARQALEWIKQLNIKGRLYTWIQVDNDASIALAKKNGFECESYTDDGMWVLYVYKEPGNKFK